MLKIVVCWLGPVSQLVVAGIHYQNILFPPLSWSMYVITGEAMKNYQYIHRQQATLSTH